MAQLLRKISRATVFGDKADVIEIVMKDRKADHELYRVGGVCTHIERMKSKKFDRDDEQDSDEKREFKFIGEFVAVNAKTGEIFESPVCFLPPFAANILAGQFVEGTEGVEFSFVIGAKYAEGGALPYEYTVAHLGDRRPDERLTRITNLLAKPAQKAISKAKE